ncbi:Uncharacterised protein [Pseudomonas aeruginosa]|nr:Uncharacterised protein [Pseudomonas aeruginosa]
MPHPPRLGIGRFQAVGEREASGEVLVEVVGEVLPGLRRLLLLQRLAAPERALAQVHQARRQVAAAGRQEHAVENVGATADVHLVEIVTHQLRQLRRGARRVVGLEFLQFGVERAEAHERVVVGGGQAGLLRLQPLQRRGVAFGDGRHGIELAVQALLQLGTVLGAEHLQAEIRRARPAAEIDRLAQHRLLVDVAQGLADIGHGQRVEAEQQARAGLQVLQLQQRRLQHLDLLDLHVETRGIATGQATTARPEALPHGLGRRAGGGVQDRIAIARVERWQGALVVAGEVVEEAQRLSHADIVDAQQGVVRQCLVRQGHGDEVLGLQVIDGAFQTEQVIGQLERRPLFHQQAVAGSLRRRDPFAAKLLLQLHGEVLQFLHAVSQQAALLGALEQVLVARDEILADAIAPDQVDAVDLLLQVVDQFADPQQLGRRGVSFLAELREFLGQGIAGAFQAVGEEVGVQPACHQVMEVIRRRGGDPAQVEGGEIGRTLGEQRAVVIGQARQAAGVVAAAQGIVTQLQKVVERRPAVVDGLGEQAIVALQRSGAGDQVLRRQVVLPLAGVVALLQAGLAIAADRPQVARLAFQQAAQRSHQQALGNAAIRVVDTCIQGGKPGTGKRQRSEAPARRL